MQQLTTRQKIGRMFTPPTVDKIERAGLKIVDKQDFDITVQGYAEMRAENRDLKARVKQLETRIQELNQVSLLPATENTKGMVE